MFGIIREHEMCLFFSKFMYFKFDFTGERAHPYLYRFSKLNFNSEIGNYSAKLAQVRRLCIGGTCMASANQCIPTQQRITDAGV